MKRGFLFLFFLVYGFCFQLVTGVAEDLAEVLPQLHLSRKLAIRSQSTHLPRVINISRSRQSGDSPIRLSPPLTLAIDRRSPQFLVPDSPHPKPVSAHPKAISAKKESVIKAAVLFPAITVAPSKLKPIAPSPPASPSPVVITAPENNRVKTTTHGNLPSSVAMNVIIGLLLAVAVFYGLNQRRLKKPLPVRADREHEASPTVATPTAAIVPVIGGRQPLLQQEELSLPSASEESAEKLAKEGVATIKEDKAALVGGLLNGLKPYYGKARKVLNRSLRKLDGSKMQGSAGSFSSRMPLFADSDGNPAENKEKQKVPTGELVPSFEGNSINATHKQSVPKKRKKSLLPFSLRRSSYKKRTRQYAGKVTHRAEKEQGEAHQPSADTQQTVADNPEERLQGDKESAQRLSGSQREMALSAYRKTSSKQ